MVGRFRHRGLLPAPNPHLYLVSQTLQPQVPPSALPMSGSPLCGWNSQVQMNSSCTARTISQPEWRTRQSNSAKQSLPIYQDELGAMNHFVNFMRFVLRNRENKRTIRRPFTHWPFTFINTAVVSVISISQCRARGNSGCIKSIKSWILFQDRILLCNSVGKMYNLFFEKKSHTWFGLGALW